jgi:hypothetical protein
VDAVLHCGLRIFSRLSIRWSLLVQMMIWLWLTCSERNIISFRLLAEASEGPRYSAIGDIIAGIFQNRPFDHSLTGSISSSIAMSWSGYIGPKSYIQPHAGRRQHSLRYMNYGSESEAMTSEAGSRCKSPNRQACMLLLMGRIGRTSIQRQCSRPYWTSRLVRETQTRALKLNSKPL